MPVVEQMPFSLGITETSTESYVNLAFSRIAQYRVPVVRAEATITASAAKGVRFRMCKGERAGRWYR
jgi:hypothetical protein